jgi:hypothetical protein
MYNYYLPEPPYFLLIAGLFIAITCGLAFEATLKQRVRAWFKSPSDQLIQASLFRLPFLGICLGIAVFLSAGLEIFLYDRWLSYSLAVPVTILTGALVWTQLDKLLLQLKQGGSKSIDLDDFT